MILLRHWVGQEQLTQIQAAVNLGVSLNTVRRHLEDGYIINGVLYTPVRGK